MLWEFLPMGCETVGKTRRIWNSYVGTHSPRCLRALAEYVVGGYDILNHLLRSKAQLINMTGFETLFEFLGLNFRSTE